MEAYSEATKTTYSSWDALVEAEANGYVVIAVITRDSTTWPWVHGPYPDKKEASKARARLLRKMKKDDWKYPTTKYKMFIRPAWKG